MRTFQTLSESFRRGTSRRSHRSPFSRHGVSTSASRLVTDAETVNPRCVVTAATKLVENGGSGEWSQTTDELIYNKIDEVGIYHVYVSDPDGETEMCITYLKAPGAPGPSRHKSTVPGTHRGNTS